MVRETKNTYTTKVIPLISREDQRDSQNTEDDVMINFLPELTYTAEAAQQLCLVKRNGTEETIATTGAGVIRGIHSWDEVGKFYVVIDRDIYIYTISTLVLETTLTNAFTTGTTQVGFTEFLYSTGTVVLMCTEGTTLNRITSANAITSSATVAGTVGTHIATPVYYNGYLLLVKSGTGDCYNSDVDDPMTWTAGNFITAEISSDDVSQIAKLNNYFVLFGRYSIEYFYDVGNPTGTPFARNDVFVKNIGYKYNTYKAITQYGNRLFFLGYKANSSLDVFSLEDFKVESITTPAVRRYLEAIGSTAYLNVISINGHDLLLLAASNRCYYYSINTGVWGRLAYKSDTLDFDIKLATTVLNSNVKTTYFATTLDNAISKFSTTLYQDDGENFTCVMRTRPLDFGTNNQKYLSSLTINADRKGTGNITVEASDDDYQTYPISRTISLDQEYPNAQQWGRFRKRAFRLTYTTNHPLRIRGMELDLNIGVT
jgi:hypothetical protein